MQAAEGFSPDVDDEKRILLSDLWIQTKDKRFTPLVPNAVQEALLDDVAPGWRDGDYALSEIRKIILKARQFGYSTVILALLFLNTANNSDVNTVVIADDESNTEELFQKIHLFYAMLPEGKRPRTKYNNKKQLHFLDLRSKLTILTAGKLTAGRSRTIHNLHCSEVPHWPNPAILTGLLQAVPAGGAVFLESTANGEDPVFCIEYRKAEKGESPYTALFTAWWQHPEYEASILPEDFTRTDEDAEVATKHDLDERFGRERADKKLLWRRLKKSEPGMGNLFDQEYPGDPKSAFRVSGKSFFIEWDDERHVVEPFDIPNWWTPIGAVDWGYGKPWCFLLGYIGPQEEVVITDELYGDHILNPDQVSRIQKLLTERGHDPTRVEIYCDPSMWNVKTSSTTGVGERDIQCYYDAELTVIQANNRRTGDAGSGGWSNVRQYLHDDITDPDTGAVLYPALRVFKGRCPNLVRTLPQMVHDDRRPEDMESDEHEDHGSDCLRYLTNSFIRATQDPNASPAPKPKPKNRWEKMDEEYKRRNRKPFL